MYLVPIQSQAMQYSEVTVCRKKGLLCRAFKCMPWLYFRFIGVSTSMIQLTLGWLLLVMLSTLWLCIMIRFSVTMRYYMKQTRCSCGCFTRSVFCKFYVGHNWDISGTYLGHIWDISWAYMVGGRWTMRGTPGREPHFPYQIPNISYQIWNIMSF